MAQNLAHTVPDEGLDFRDYLDGIGSLYAGLANVGMQMALPGVGHGVVFGAVESGSVLKHPVKRGRTTFTYLAVAMLGTDEDRRAMRDAVNGQHRQVVSAPDAPVKYNAFDRELQLWVAACLCYGVLDIVERIRGPLTQEEREAIYRHGSRFGTTLQVSEDQWPADVAAFDEYWRSGLTRIGADAPVRGYVRAVMSQRGVPRVGRPLATRMAFMNRGFMPPEFRAIYGIDWSRIDQRRFDKVIARTRRVSRWLPRFVRNFPFNVLLWDVRRRARSGRPIV